MQQQEHGGTIQPTVHSHLTNSSKPKIGLLCINATNSHHCSKQFLIGKSKLGIHASIGKDTDMLGPIFKKSIGKAVEMSVQLQNAFWIIIILGYRIYNRIILSHKEYFSWKYGIQTNDQVKFNKIIRILTVIEVPNTWPFRTVRSSTAGCQTTIFNIDPTYSCVLNYY